MHKRGDARGTREVRRCSSFIDFHRVVPQSSSHIGPRIVIISVRTALGWEICAGILRHLSCGPKTLWGVSKGENSLKLQSCPLSWPNVPWKKAPTSPPHAVKVVEAQGANLCASPLPLLSLPPLYLSLSSQPPLYLPCALTPHVPHLLACASPPLLACASPCPCSKVFLGRGSLRTQFALPILIRESAPFFGAPPTIILCWQPLGPARPTRLSVRHSSHTPWLGVGTFGWNVPGENAVMQLRFNSTSPI